MGTTAEKLTYLNGTKTLLKDTINYTGAGITNETFRQYPEKLYNEYCNILKDDSALFNGMPKVTGTGTSLTINNTADSRMSMSLAPSELVQEINLFDGVTSNGYIGFDGSIVSDNNWIASTNYIKISQYTDYKITGTNMGARVLYIFYNSSQGKIGSRQETTAGTTFTSIKNAEYMRFSTNNTSATNMIVTAVPTPTSPVAIHTITGDNTITIANSNNTQSQTLPLNLGTEEYCKIGNYEDEFYKASGKNLFDKNGNKTVGYIYANDGSKSVSTSDDFCLDDYISVKPNTSYAISGSKYIRVCEYNSTKGFIERTVTTGNDTFAIFTTTANTYYVRISALVYNLDYIQLEQGLAVTTYEPYGTSWYLKKNIGKYIFDENTDFFQNWNTDPNYETYCLVRTLNTGLGASAVVISNILPYVSGVYAYDKIGIFQDSNSNGRVIFRVPKAIASSITDFQTWLSTHSMVFYTPMAPTYTLLNNTLQTELDNIYNKALSYQDQTNISQTNDDLSFIISANCIKDYNNI